MAKSAKPTIVLIHGAWHTAEGWRPLQDVLEAAGFPTRAVTMPSSGSSNPKEESATKDAALIRSAIVEPLLAESAEFVMVSHSYGVIPASGAIDESMSVAERAMKGLEGGVLGMIFIAGIPAPSNKSMSGACGLGPADFAPFVDQHPEGYLTVRNAEDIFYNDLPPAEAKRRVDALLTMSANALASGVESPAWDNDTLRPKTAFIFAEHDNAIPLEVQKTVATKAGIKHTATLPSSHSPFLSMPHRTAEAIAKFAEGFAK